MYKFEYYVGYFKSCGFLLYKENGFVIVQSELFNYKRRFVSLREAIAWLDSFMKI